MTGLTHTGWKKFLNPFFNGFRCFHDLFETPFETYSEAQITSPSRPEMRVGIKEGIIFNRTTHGFSHLSLSLACETRASCFHQHPIFFARDLRKRDFSLKPVENPIDGLLSDLRVHQKKILKKLSHV